MVQCNPVIARRRIARKGPGRSSPSLPTPLRIQVPFAGTALVRLHSFPPETVLALRGHLSRARLLLRFRERDEDNFCELTLNGKPWFNPKSVRSEKLLVGIIDILHRHGHNFVSNLDYGRNQGDRIIMAFSRAPRPPPLSYQQPVRLLPVFAISFISEDHLRVITPPQQSAPAILQTVRGSWPRGVLSEKKVAENVYEFKLKGYGWFQEHTFATDSLRHTLSLLGSLDSFGYTLLTSLSLNGRTRSKDLWVFAGLSQTKPRELQPSGPLVSRTDRAREPGQTRPTAHSTTATITTDRQILDCNKELAAPLSHSLSQSSISSKSSIVQRLVPRAQLPPAPLSHTSSQTSVSSESSVVRRSVPRAQLAPAHSSHDLSPGPISSQLNSVQKPAPRAQLPPPSSYNPPPGSILPKSSIVQMQKPAQRDQLPVSVAKSVTSDHGVYDGHLSPQIALWKSSE
ncbi:hypothetical protein BC826DRAFT_1100568 [Russula brevipes]|nr:hypothetical protein BC826DRAFT_1100568 [Russula brevipes]